jgi:hypothetical protein
VMPGAKSSRVGLANDLNPEMFRDSSCIFCSRFPFHNPSRR